MLKKDILFSCIYNSVRNKGRQRFIAFIMQLTNYSFLTVTELSEKTCETTVGIFESRE